MRLRFFITLLVLFVLQLIGTLGCQSCTDQKYFSVIRVFLENGRLINEATQNVESLDINERVAYDKFCMTLTTGLEYAYNRKSQFFINSPPFSFHELSASCKELTPLPTQHISQLTIVSNADFVLDNELFITAGESLNNHIVLSYGMQSRIPISDFLSSSDNHPMEIPIYLFITSIPAYNQLHRFSVTYVLDDGQSFSTSTEKVIITSD